MAYELDLFNLERGHASEIAALTPVALELARRARPEGVTVADLRAEATRRGLLTGEESGRRLSYLGVVMKAAGLHPTGRFVRSSIDRSHGNLHQVWTLG